MINNLLSEGKLRKESGKDFSLRLNIIWGGKNECNFRLPWL